MQYYLLQIPNSQLFHTHSLFCQTLESVAVLVRVLQRNGMGCVCVCMCVHYTYIYIYTHTHMYVHVYERDLYGYMRERERFISRDWLIYPYTHIWERERFSSRNWLIMIVQTAKSKICRVGQ